VLQEGVVQPTTEIFDPGLPPNRYAPTTPGAHSVVLVARARLATSSGDRHPATVFLQSRRRLRRRKDRGLGNADRRLRAPSASAADRHRPAREAPAWCRRRWKRRTYAESWSTGDTNNFSIGQGFLTVTPLVNMVATVANGAAYQPNIVQAIRPSGA
jgi:penicillin-binding protein 2